MEILLLCRLEPGVWEALLRPAKRLKEETRIEIGDGSAPHLLSEVLERRDGGVGVVRFSDERLLEACGKVALPPYIHLPLDDAERYQTVYARVKGSVAAPAAGLHFSLELMGGIREAGAEFTFVTLHVGRILFSQCGPKIYTSTGCIENTTS